MKAAQLITAAQTGDSAFIEQHFHIPNLISALLGVQNKDIAAAFQAAKDAQQHGALNTLAQKMNTNGSVFSQFLAACLEQPQLNFMGDVFPILDIQYHNTLLYPAVRNGRKDMLEIFVQHGMLIDGERCLQAVVRSQHLPTLVFVLNHISNPKYSAESRTAALETASANNWEDGVDALWDGSDPQSAVRRMKMQRKHGWELIEQKLEQQKLREILQSSVETTKHHTTRKM